MSGPKNPDPRVLAQITPELREAVASKAESDGRISCPMLRKLAEDHGVPYTVAGACADELQIRVRDCGLGCF